jgi:hypothetical protein
MRAAGADVMTLKLESMAEGCDQRNEHKEDF